MKTWYISYLYKCVLLVLLTGTTFFSNAQDFSAGINTESPNPNAVLHLVSPNGDQGLMIPKLTTTQRNAMSLAASDNGLLIFDSDENVFYFWFNPNWIVLSTGSGQTLSLSGDNLSILNGNSIDLSTVDNQSLSLSGNTLTIDNGNSVDLSSVGAGNQDLSLSGNSLSLSGDASPVDLSGFLDDTDDQTLTLTGTSLAISEGNSVDLSGIAGDNQDLTLSGNTLSLTNDATTVDLSSFLDNTDAQTLSLTGTDLTIADGNTVDLSGIAGDNQDLELAGNTLTLTNDGTTVDLSGYLDNTDEQDLTLAGNTLSLTNDATPVDLSGYLDNTDAQTLSLAGTDLTISDGNTVDLSGIAGDNQDLDLVGNTLSLTNDGTTVDLSGYLDNTDEQNLSFSVGVISLSGSAGTVDLSTYDDDGSDDITTADLGTGVGQVLSFATANTLPALDGTALTNVTSTNFSGTLAGDVTGTQGATVVSSLQGDGLNITTPGTGDILEFDGTDWVNIPNASLSTTDVPNAAGDITGDYASGLNVNTLQGSGLIISTPGAGEILEFNGTDWVNTPNASLSTTDVPNAAGDITGDYASGLNVNTLQGSGLIISTPGAGEILEFDGTDWVNIPNNSIATTDVPNAAGDITGDYASGLNVNTLQGSGLIISTPGAGEILEFDGTDWVNIPNNSIATTDVPNAAGDITGDYASGLNVNTLQGSGLIISTPGAGEILEFDGTDWVNIPNNSIATTDVPNAAGDITGDYASGLNVNTLQGSGLIISTPGAGEILEFDGTDWVNIPNTSIDAGATPNPAGDIGGDYASGLVINALQGDGLNIVTATGGDILEFDGTNWINIPNTSIDAGATPNPAGDIGGDYASGLVINALQGDGLNIVTATGGDILEFDGTNWINIPNTAIDAGATPNPAGDIGGDYASGLVINALQGDGLNIVTATGGDILEFDGTNWINIPNTAIDAGATPNPAGDIGGDYASGLVINALQGDGLNIVTATGGDILEFDGTNWINIPNTSIDAGATPNPAGDIGGDYASGLVINALQGDGLNIVTATGGDILEFDGTNWINIPNTSIDAGATPNPAGDIGGDYASGLVINALQGDGLNIVTATGGDILEFDGTNWINIPNTAIDAGATPNPAGDIGGDYASGLVINALQGDGLNIVTATGGDILEFDGTNWINIPNTAIDAGATPNPAGDIGGDYASGLVINALQGDGLNIVTATGGDILEFDGTDWVNIPNTAVDAGATPNPAGDIGGDYTSGLSVDGIQGVSLNLAGLASNDILQYDGTDWINIPFNAFDPTNITTDLTFENSAPRNIIVNATATGNGQNLTVQSGISTTGGFGGTLNLYAGGSSDNAGGNVELQAGVGDLAGGEIQIWAGDATNISGGGGNVNISAGNGGSSGGSGGIIQLTPGTNGVNQSHVDIFATSALKLPVGTGAEQPPSPLQGMIRFNTDGNFFEGNIDGSPGGWVDITGGGYASAAYETLDETVTLGSALPPPMEFGTGNFQLGAVSPSGKSFLSASSHGGQGSEVRLSAARGTQGGGESQLLNGDLIGEVVFDGYHAGGVYSIASTISVQASEDWNAATNTGTNMAFHITPNATNSLTEVLNLSETGIKSPFDVEVGQNIYFPEGSSHIIGVEPNSGAAGDNLTIHAGDFGGGGPGGTLTLTGGQGEDGGPVSINAGTGLSTNGGNVDLIAGNGANNGGDINITPGTGSTNGFVNINGNSITNGNSSIEGNIDFPTGSDHEIRVGSNGGGVGNTLTVAAGDGSGGGGVLRLYSGSGPVGGDIIIESLNGGPGAGGNVSVIASAGLTTNPGGNVNIDAGAGGSGGANGGDIVLTPGVGGGGNPDGEVTIDGTLNIVGSERINVFVTNTDYTVMPNDRVIIYDGAGGDIVTFPAAVDFPGMVITVTIKQLTTTLSINVPDNIAIPGSTNYNLDKSPSNVSSATFVSDGVDFWALINKVVE